MSTTPQPDEPLPIPTRGLGKVEHLRVLLDDLGGRLGVRSGHITRPEKGGPVADDRMKTLRYFQFSKATGVAKVLEMARIHQVLLKALPDAVKTPYRARKYSGTLKANDIHGFHKHWLGVLRKKAEEAGR